MTYIQNNRDRNERGLIELWTAAGCLVIQMSKDAGFDNVVVCPRTGVHIVEVKNPTYKWKLRPAEEKRKAEVEAAGGTYNIIETDEQARRMIGLL